MNSPNPKARILVVDDDQELASVISRHIQSQGMYAAVAGDADAFALAMHGDPKPDLVLLDLLLKQQDGLDLLRQLRKDSDLPVIIMTGHRRDEIDRVVGLELGADDYLAKPFGLHEMTARIRAVLRRHAMHARRPAQRKLYRFGDWLFDSEARTLSADQGHVFTLTNSEYALLHAFLQAPQRVLSRELLLRSTRVHEDVFDRSIDVQILRLRRKLERDPQNPCYIVTHRGAGYMLAADVAVEL